MYDAPDSKCVRTQATRPLWHVQDVDVSGMQGWGGERVKEARVKEARRREAEVGYVIHVTQ